MSVRHLRVETTGREGSRFYRRLPVATSVVAGMVLALAGCGNDPPASESAVASSGCDSPQAVFDAEKQALANDDTGALFDLYSPNY